MKQLDVVWTTKVGPVTTVKALKNVGVRELNNMWRAMHDALGHMADSSDVGSVLEVLQGPEYGVADVTMTVTVTKQGNRPFTNGTWTWANMNAQQSAYLLAAFTNSFAKADVKWQKV